MVNNILVPTDGSKGAERGVEHALELAEKEGAKLHTLFVVDERIYGQTPALSSDELFLEEIQTRGDKILEQIVRQAERRDIEATAECVRGVPHEMILKCSQQNNIDLIVMGQHGLSKSRSPHLGSSTDRVTRLGAIPVISA